MVLNPEISGGFQEAGFLNMLLEWETEITGFEMCALG